MSSPLKNNTTTIQNLINTINSLPEAGGVDLPELSNPATSEELFANKELIDGDGNVVTGTFSIDSELSTQDDLISQIQSALQGKAAGDSGNGTNSFPYNVTFVTQSSVTPIICYGDDGDTVTIITVTNTGGNLGVSWTCDNCTRWYSGRHTSADPGTMGDYAVFHNFTGDATITITYDSGTQ